tara:strand:+ start:3035 stop:3313 length:279 start_codon:yes stop_codon:yes gene_type:complete
MKIKIVSDGTCAGTRVLDASTGTAVQGVQLISFMASPQGAPEAFLHVAGVQCEIITDCRMGLELRANPYTVEDLELVPDELKAFFGHDDSTD